MKSGKRLMRIWIVFVCVAALTILDRLDLVDVETLGWWLAERQLPCGGLNGRPEKLEDVRLRSILYPTSTLTSPLTVIITMPRGLN